MVSISPEANLGKRRSRIRGRIRNSVHVWWPHPGPAPVHRWISRNRWSGSPPWRRDSRIISFIV